METIRLTATIGEDGRVHIDAPSTLPPGPAEIVVVVNPLAGRRELVDWSDAYGLGKEIWEGIDAQKYVDQLRDE
jgi:hypothetical protein